MKSYTNTSPEEYFEYFCKDEVAIEKYEKVVEDVLRYQEEAEIARYQLEHSEERVYQYERLIDEIHNLNVKDKLDIKNIAKAMQDIGIEL